MGEGKKRGKTEKVKESEKKWMSKKEKKETENQKQPQTTIFYCGKVRFYFVVTIFKKSKTFFQEK